MRRFTMRKTLFAATCLLIPFIPVHQPARADVESSRVVLGPGAKDLVVGPGMDAAGRDLRGCEFVTQDLTGAVFDRCNLYGVRIDGCILKGASFRGAVFLGANVEIGLDDGVDFTDATINGNWRSSAEGFDFYGAVLSPRQLMSTWSYNNKELRQCQIRGSDAKGAAVGLDFRGADLRQTTFWGDLSKCDFTNARIDGAYFGNAAITFEQLASTWDFQHGSLRVRLAAGTTETTGVSRRWDFSRIGLRGSDLSILSPDAVFADARIDGCTMRMGFTRTQLCATASYKEGSLAGLRLMGTDLSGCDLSGINLTGCVFSHCTFAGVDFNDAVITDARFVTDRRVGETDRLTVEQLKSTWNYKHGRMRGIHLPDHLSAALAKDGKPQGSDGVGRRPD